MNIYDSDGWDEIQIQHNRVLKDGSIKQLLDTIPIALMLLNTKRQIVYFNRTLGKMGGEDSNILGKRPGDIFHCIHARTTHIGCSDYHHCRSCKVYYSTNQALEGITNAEECRINTRHDESYEVKDLVLRVHSAPFRINDEKFIVFIVEDIGECKKKEEIEKSFYQLFQNIKSGVAIYRAIDDGNDFVFTDFNKAAERIENKKKGSLIGKRVTDVFPGIDNFGLLDVFKTVWKTGKAQDHPVTFYSDNRISGWRENYVFRLPDGDIVSVYNDITERKQAEKKLEETKNRLDTIVNSVQTAILIINPETHIIEDANPMAEKLIGLQKEDIIGHICHKFVCPAECGSCPVTDLKKEVDCSEKILLNKSGQKIPILKTVISETFGNKHHLIESFIDIRDRKDLERKLKYERNQLFTIFDSIDEAIYIADPNTFKILAVNKKMRSLYGKKLVGRICYSVLHGFDVPCDFCTNRIILKNKDDLYRWEYHNPEKNMDFYITNRIIRWPDGRDVRFELAVDITEKMRIERILEQRALIDSLTGIGNRRALEDEFERVLKHSQRTSEVFTIIMIDIDYFKKFNDTYGHTKGDECLSQVAGALKSNIQKPLDSVFRYGGEEFLVILPNTDREGGKIVSERIRRAVLDLQIRHESSDVHENVSISQGIYSWKGNTQMTASQIIEQADNSLYRAKEAGRNCIK